MGGEVSAADCAFHGGRPSGSSPVAGEKDARPRGRSSGTVGIDAGARRVGGVDFFDYRGFDESRFAGGGEKFTDFGESEVDDFAARFFDEGFRGADDELDVAGVSA